MSFLEAGKSVLKTYKSMLGYYINKEQVFQGSGIEKMEDNLTNTDPLFKQLMDPKVRLGKRVKTFSS